MTRVHVVRWLPTSGLAVMTLAGRKSITRLEEHCVISSSTSSALPSEGSIAVLMHTKECLMTLFCSRLFSSSMRPIAAHVCAIKVCPSTCHTDRIV